METRISTLYLDAGSLLRPLSRSIKSVRSQGEGSSWSCRSVCAMNFVTETWGWLWRCSAPRGPGAMLSAVHDAQDNLKFMTSLHFSPAASATQRPQSAADSNPALQVGIIPVLQTRKRTPWFQGKHPSSV